MLFNSYSFIFLFLPITFLLYFLMNKLSPKCGKAVLILASLLFYGLFDYRMLILLCASILLNYLFARIMVGTAKKKSALFAIPVLINVFLLLFFKYSGFTVGIVGSFLGRDIPLIDIFVPLGISFYTFQQIAYLTCVWRGTVDCKMFFDYVLYIVYFPKLLMGPLTGPTDFMQQINDESLKRMNGENVAAGIRLFSFGLFKKVLIADVFAKGVTWAFGNFDSATSMDWILVMLCYTFEIYFDFSGYSDMAIGSSLLFNINLPMNFNSPYKAISIRDFWKRWHMTLTQFFTEHIYFPIGGSKKNMRVTIRNTMIVFLISGIWHGDNWTFILWGIFHGIFSVYDRLNDERQQKMSKPGRWLCTFTVVNVLWLLFRADTVKQWWTILLRIISFRDLSVSQGLISCFTIPEDSILRSFRFLYTAIDYVSGFWMLVYMVGTMLACLLWENVYNERFKNTRKLMVLAALAFVISVMSFSGESVFVYFNF